MSTDQATDALILIAPEIEKLMGDDTLIEKFKNRKKADNSDDAVKFGAITILGIATHLLREHRNATWNILGAINQLSPEEIGRQLLPVTIKQISETLNDKDLLSFFTPSVQLEPEIQSAI